MSTEVCQAVPVTLACFRESGAAQKSARLPLSTQLAWKSQVQHVRLKPASSGELEASPVLGRVCRKGDSLEDAGYLSADAEDADEYHAETEMEARRHDRATRVRKVAAIDLDGFTLETSACVSAVPYLGKEQEVGASAL